MAAFLPMLTLAGDVGEYVASLPIVVATTTIKGAQDLAIPILTSTLTTMAAFLPMLTLAGDVGEYVASLPIVVATTLAVSFFVAMLVTPIMCMWLLKADGLNLSRHVRGRADRRTLR